MRVWWALGWCAGLLVLLGISRWSGTRATVVAVAALLIAATSIRLLFGSWGARKAIRAEAEVADACSVLAAQMRVGRVPAEALHGAAQDCQVLALASKGQDLGGDVTEVWRRQAGRPGHGGLASLARAWQVSTQTGAPLAHSLEQVSKALTAEVALRSVVASELSAARATGKIMAVLPLLGLGMGYLLGGDPLQFLLSKSWGWGCLIVGVALASAGVLWIDKLAQPTMQPGQL